MFLTHLSCTACGLRQEWQALQNLCPACGKPLFPVYDLAAVGQKLTREALRTREKSLWRYREVLPLPDGGEIVSLGEGGTPLLPAKRFGESIGLTRSLDQRRIAKSNAEFQGAGHGCGRFDGETSRREKTCRAQRGKCRRRHGRLRRARRTRSACLHAARYATGQHHRVPRSRRARDLD